MKYYKYTPLHEVEHQKEATISVRLLIKLTRLGWDWRDGKIDHINRTEQSYDILNRYASCYPGDDNAF